MYSTELVKLSERIELSNMEIVGVQYSPLPPLPPFDDLGYNIPNKMEGGTWLISDDLKKQYNFYQNEGDSKKTHSALEFVTE